MITVKEILKQVDDGKIDLSQFEGLDEDALVSGVSALTRAIVTNGERENALTMKVEALLNAVFLKIILTDRIGKEDKNIQTVYGVLANPIGLEYLDKIMSSDAITEAERPARAAYLEFLYPDLSRRTDAHKAAYDAALICMQRFA